MLMPLNTGQVCLQMLEKGLALSAGGEVGNPLAPTCAECCLNPPAAVEEGINGDCPAQSDLDRGNLVGICNIQDSMKAARKPLQNWGALLGSK